MNPLQVRNRNFVTLLTLRFVLHAGYKSRFPIKDIRHRDGILQDAVRQSYECQVHREAQRKILQDISSSFRSGGALNTGLVERQDNTPWYT